MAVGAIYSRAIAEGGVRHALSTENPAVLDVQISVANRPLGPADYQKLRQDIEGMAGERVGFLTRELHRLGRTQDNWLVASLANPNPPSSSAPVGRPFFLTGFQEHTRLLDGRWPQTTSTINDGTLELEIAVGQRAATTMQWDLDTQIYLYPFRGDPTQRVLISLVGLVEPIDATEEYWLPAPVYFNVRDEGERSFIPMYMREEAFFSGLGANYPATIGDFTWFLYVDPKVVTASNAGSAEEALTRPGDGT